MSDHALLAAFQPLAMCGPYEIRQAQYGLIAVNGDGCEPQGWKPYRAGPTQEGVRLHCGGELVRLMLYIVEDNGEAWCVRHFGEALELEMPAD